MAEVGQYGQAMCATCGGRGILTDREGRPSPCVPCSSERRERSLMVLGYVVECYACTAVLTVEDVRARQKDNRGPLCGGCVKGLERQSA